MKEEMKKEKPAVTAEKVVSPAPQVPSKPQKDDDYITIDFRGLTLPWAIVISVFFVTLGLSIAIYLGIQSRPIIVQSSSIPTPSATPMPTFQPTEFSEVTIPAADKPTFGNTKAQVVVVEYGDFLCTFCQKFFAETYPAIKQNYVDSNKIQFQFRDFPLSIHEPGATKASQMGICINRTYNLNKFQAYHDLILGNPGTYSGSTSSGLDINTDKIKEMFSKIGVDYNKISACMTSAETAAELKKDKDAFTKLNSYVIESKIEPNGLGTPLFVIGKVQPDGSVKGRLINGAYPYTAFQAVIDEQLTK